MLTVDLNSLDLIEETSELDPTEALRFAFPLSAAEGTASSAAVLFELEPGRRLARHTDSAEEVLVVLAGAGEAVVGEERAAVRAGQLAVVPASVPHEVLNTGSETMRVLGVFSASAVVSTFERPAAPGAPQVFVTGAPVELAAALEEGAAA